VLPRKDSKERPFFGRDRLTKSIRPITSPHSLVYALCSAPSLFRPLVFLVSLAGEPHAGRYFQR
jgi:hypothetical protein